MRLTVDRQAFSAALGQAAKYVETRTESPVLSTVLLRTGDGDIEIAATDQNRLFGATIEARVEIKARSRRRPTCLPASFAAPSEGMLNWRL